MKRALDELADVFHQAGARRYPRRVTSFVDLSRQFGLPITPSRWAHLERLLPCRLPPLERRSEGLWAFPCGWKTVWDLAAHVARCCPDWQPPPRTSTAD